MRRATCHGPRATCHVPRAACHVPRAASWPLPRGIGPLQRASWQEKVARGHEMARKTSPEANFHGFVMKFHDLWHRIFDAILAGICYVFCIEILARISVFLALARKTQNVEIVRIHCKNHSILACRTLQQRHFFENARPKNATKNTTEKLPKSMQKVMKIRGDFENPWQIPFLMHFGSFWHIFL